RPGPRAVQGPRDGRRRQRHRRPPHRPHLAGPRHRVRHRRAGTGGRGELPRGRPPRRRDRAPTHRVTTGARRCIFRRPRRHPMPADSPTPPYDALAAGYDVVMAHVDYAEWADHVLDLLDAHGAAPRSILELGCGTGSLAIELHERGPFRYLGTDRSAAMVRVARAKA